MNVPLVHTSAKKKNERKVGKNESKLRSLVTEVVIWCDRKVSMIQEGFRAHLCFVTQFLWAMVGKYHSG